MTEAQWDKLLKIRSSGRDDTHSDQYRFPYEPTPYPVLEKMSFILRPLPQRASARHTRRFHKCNAFVEGRKR